jgi:hypothetical protein
LLNEKQVFTIVQDHTDAVWEAVWDQGLDGVGEEKYGGILLELYEKLDVMDIARQDKLKVGRPSSRRHITNW